MSSPKQEMQRTLKIPPKPSNYEFPFNVKAKDINKNHPYFMVIFLNIKDDIDYFFLITMI